MNPYETCSEPNFWLSCMTIDEESKTKPLDIIEALEREYRKPSDLETITSTTSI